MSAPLIPPVPSPRPCSGSEERPGSANSRVQGSYARDALWLGSRCLVAFGSVLLGFGCLVHESIFPRGLSILAIGVGLLAADRLGPRSLFRIPVTCRKLLQSWQLRKDLNDNVKCDFSFIIKD